MAAASPTPTVPERLWRQLGWTLVAAAIVVQSMIQHQFGSLRAEFFNGDKIYQVTSARAILDGEGVSHREANFADLSSPYVKPLFNWPVGYAYLVAAVLHYVPDPVRAVQAIDYTAIAVFFVFWFAILELLGKTLSPGTKAIFWSVWVMVTSPLVPVTSTEMLAAALFAAALLAGLMALRGRWPVVWAVAAAVAAVGAATMRYSYWPLLAVVPLSLAAAAFTQERRRPWLAAAVACAVFSALLIAGLAFYQKYSSGYSTYIEQRYAGQQGLYWSGLRYVYPFPASMVGFLDFWWSILAPRMNWGDVPLFPLAWKVSLGVLAILLLGGVHRFLTRTSRGREDSQASGAFSAEALRWFFVAAGVFTVLLTFAMLGGLSLLTPGYEAGSVAEGHWTYLVEDRYYTPFAPFFVLALAAVLHGFWQARHRGRILLKGLAAGFLIAWLLAGVYTRHHLLGVRGPRERPMRKAILRDVKIAWDAVRRHRDQGCEVVYMQRDDIPSDEYYPEYVLVAGSQMAGASQLPSGWFTRPIPPPTKPVVLMSWIRDRDLGRANSVGAKIRGHGRFVQVARLWQGTLWEAMIRPSEKFPPLGSPPAAAAPATPRR